MASKDSFIERVLMPLAADPADTTNKSGSQVIAGTYAVAGAVLGSIITRSRLSKQLGAETVSQVPPILKVLF